MAVKQFLKSSGLAALAAGLAIAVLPAAASAEEWGRRDGRGEDRGQHEQRREGEGRSWQQRQQQPAPQAPAQVQVQQQAPRPQWNGGQRGDWQARSQPTPVQQTRPAEQARGWNSGAPGAVRQAESRQGGTWQQRQQRANEWRGEQRHDEARRDDRWRGNDGWRGDTRRGNDTWRSGDNRQWSRDWRRDNRYNWSSWRSNHRETYRLGRYYAPYRDWSYRRLSIGFYLDRLFFASDYWIDDPWSYRLPEAYGPYRWVRYYDDALMVDIYSGEVVDVIYDFFE